MVYLGTNKDMILKIFLGFLNLILLLKSGEIVRLGCWDFFNGFSSRWFVGIIDV